MPYNGTLQTPLDDLNDIAAYRESAILPIVDILEVDISATDWTPPAGVIVRSIETLDGGEGTVKIDTPNQTGVTIHISANRKAQRITKIYKLGTAATNIRAGL